MDLIAMQELANAIILRAVKDYREAKKIYKNKNYSLENRQIAKTHIRDCEQFFTSQAFKVYTKIDGEKLLKDLKNEL